MTTAHHGRVGVEVAAQAVLLGAAAALLAEPREQVGHRRLQPRRRPGAGGHDDRGRRRVVGRQGRDAGRAGRVLAAVDRPDERAAAAGRVQLGRAPCRVERCTQLVSAARRAA